jgi:hypothetical protein
MSGDYLGEPSCSVTGCTHSWVFQPARRALARIDFALGQRPGDDGAFGVAFVARE